MGYRELKAEYEALQEKQRRVEIKKEMQLKILQDNGCADVQAATQMIDALIDEEAELKLQVNRHMEKIQNALGAAE